MLQCTEKKDGGSLFLVSIFLTRLNQIVVTHSLRRREKATFLFLSAFFYLTLVFSFLFFFFVFFFSILPQADL